MFHALHRTIHQLAVLRIRSKKWTERSHSHVFTSILPNQNSCPPQQFISTKSFTKTQTADSDIKHSEFSQLTFDKICPTLTIKPFSRYSHIRKIPALPATVRGPVTLQCSYGPSERGSLDRRLCTICWGPQHESCKHTQVARHNQQT